MQYTQLIDRCEAILPGAPRAFIAKMLREAEIELCRRCNVLELSKSYTTTATNAYLLPNSFLHPMHVRFNGVQIDVIREIDVPRGTDGAVYTGTPSRYWITNAGGFPGLQYIYLDKTPAAGDTLDVYYYGVPSDEEASHATSSDGFIGTPDATTSPYRLPLRYHLPLTLYAIAHTAELMDNDKLFERYLVRWEAEIEKIQAEVAGREPVYEVQEVI